MMETIEMNLRCLKQEQRKVMWLNREKTHFCNNLFVVKCSLELLDFGRKNYTELECENDLGGKLISLVK